MVREVKIMKHKLRRQPDTGHSIEIECNTSKQAEKARLFFSSFKYIHTNSAYSKISDL